MWRIFPRCVQPLSPHTTFASWGKCATREVNLTTTRKWPEAFALFAFFGCQALSTRNGRSNGTAVDALGEIFIRREPTHEAPLLETQSQSVPDLGASGLA